MAEKHTKTDGLTSSMKGSTMGHWLTLNGIGRVSPYSIYHTRSFGSKSVAIGAQSSIYGPRPVNTVLKTISELECNLCTWIAVGDGLFTLKFINRMCGSHSRLIGGQEWVD